MMEGQFLKNLVKCHLYDWSNIEHLLSVKGSSSVQNIIQLQNSEWISKLKKKNKMKELLHKYWKKINRKRSKIFCCVLLTTWWNKSTLYIHQLPNTLVSALWAPYYARTTRFRRQRAACGLVISKCSPLHEKNIYDRKRGFTDFQLNFRVFILIPSLHEKLRTYQC